MTDCPNCAALRHSSRLLAEAELYLIDRNAALTAENNRLRLVHEARAEADRRAAERLLGLADLQRAPL